jgi:hypothetical protein
MGLKTGDAVRLTVSEGAFRAGATGIVLRWFEHGQGDLVVVRFDKATRVVHATSIEGIDRNGGGKPHG